MKKYFLIFIMLLAFPLSVSATSYSPDINITIEIDGSSWYVFTRDNISNNSELDDIGVSEEYMHNLMINNDIYLDAILFDEYDEDNNLEFFIRRKELPGKVGNLHTYSDKHIKELGDGIIKSDMVSATEYEIFGDEYKYITCQYYTQGYNVYQFYTTINGYGYNFLLHKVNEISSADKIVMKDIIDSIYFDVDEEYEKPIGTEKKVAINWENVFNEAIIGSSAAAVIMAIESIANRKKRKKKTNNKSTPNEGKHTICPNCGCIVVEELTICPKCKIKIKE